MQNCQVLIVNDNESHCLLLKKTLAAHGFESEFSLSGSQGIHMAQTLLPDAVLLDLCMPDMDGLSVCAEIRRLSALSRTAIVFHTAFPFYSPGSSSSKECTGDAFLTYPIDPTQLLAVLEGCIAKRRGEFCAE